MLAVGAAVGLAAVAAFGPGLPAAPAYPTPAIAVAGGNTVIAIQSSGDGLQFYWQQIGSRVT